MLAWRSEDGNWVWSFVMTERRREQADQPQPIPTSDARVRIGMVPMEAGSLVIERKMLCAIKQRAERLVGSPAA